MEPNRYGPAALNLVDQNNRKVPYPGPAPLGQRHHSLVGGT